MEHHWASRIVAINHLPHEHIERDILFSVKNSAKTEVDELSDQKKSVIIEYFRTKLLN